MSSEAHTVLLAPDKFKGSARAPAVAEALARGIAARAPRAEVVRCPIADGGDGTVEVLLAAGFHPVEVPAGDVLGRPIRTTVAVRGNLAIIELADACGPARLGGPEPLRAGSFGVGPALRAVLHRGHRDVVLALGGSASTDGGLGLLLALGAAVTDDAGAPVTPDGAGLLRARRLDLSGATLPPGVRLRLACDVDAPLHGPEGAAVVFGPQKGADADQVAALDRALVRWGRLLRDTSGRDVAAVPGAGAAGGVAAAGLALGAEVVGGAELVLDALGFAERLSRAGVVVTGEGTWDAQSVRGKGPGQVLARARTAGVPAMVVAGQVTSDPAGVARTWSLTELAGSVERARTDVLRLLDSVGRDVAGWCLETGCAVAGSGDEEEGTS